MIPWDLKTEQDLNRQKWRGTQYLAHSRCSLRSMVDKLYTAHVLASLSNLGSDFLRNLGFFPFQKHAILGQEFEVSFRPLYSLF